MGYFPNGTAADLYYAEYCYNCVHDQEWQEKEENPCPIWNLHFWWNYDAVGENKDETKEMALEMFIPRKGIENLQCKMFLEVNYDYPGILRQTAEAHD